MRTSGFARGLCTGLALSGAVAILMGARPSARDGLERIGFLLAPTIPEITYFYQLAPEVSGEVTSRWIAQDVGDAAPPDYLIGSTTVTLGPGQDGAFTLSRPTNGWPLGKYRIELLVNGRPLAVEPFVIQNE